MIKASMHGGRQGHPQEGWEQGLWELKTREAVEDRTRVIHGRTRSFRRSQRRLTGCGPWLQKGLRLRPSKTAQAIEDGAVPQGMELGAWDAAGMDKKLARAEPEKTRDEVARGRVQPRQGQQSQARTMLSGPRRCYRSRGLSVVGRHGAREKPRSGQRARSRDQEHRAGTDPKSGSLGGQRRPRKAVARGRPTSSVEREAGKLRARCWDAECKATKGGRRAPPRGRPASSTEREAAEEETGEQGC